MKISYEWLREYINTKIRAERLSHLLTMAGHEVTAQEERDKDIILDIEVTPNRSDCLSYTGIARELSAITGKELMLPSPKIVSKKSQGPEKKVTIEDKKSCMRYSARIITDLQVGPSPKWLIKRIESMGLRPVNNIVDITNFVLFETGQPLHAFDLDKINGDVVVRDAKTHEKITTIDDVERELKPNMLVISDSTKPIAVAGIMGGKATEVTERTKNILLESAHFNAISVRRTALALGLSSDSSYRFERGVDLEGVVLASERAASLIADIAKGSIGALVDAGSKKKERSAIKLRLAYLNKILGTALVAEDVKRALKQLGFSVNGSLNMSVMPPSFRDDVTREADLIEEVARIYGYETISLQAPSVITTDEDPAPKDFLRKKKVTKEALVALGFNEILTYSMLSKKAIEDMMLPQEGLIEIRNPLSKEQQVMRSSLLPGAIKTISYNVNRQIQSLRIFELSDIYFEKAASYNEEPSLVMAQYGKSSKGVSYKETTLFQLKGAVVALFAKLGIKHIDFEKTAHPLFVQDETVGILSEGVMLGVLGRIRPDILDRFDINNDLCVCEINFNTLADNASLGRSYKALPRFPFSYRDVSFALSSTVSYKELVSFMKNTGGSLVENIELLSEYCGDQIGVGQRGLALRVVYRSKEKTLEEEEINRIDTAIRQGLTKDFQATLR